jgi:uncharacterized protein
VSPEDSATVLWKRIDRPGHESARLVRLGDGWELGGTAVFVHEENPCCLRYRIGCDPDWRTRRVEVDGWLGAEAVRVEARADRAGKWRAADGDVVAIAGCVDVDLNFSPSTNLLPIRRLNLEIGEEKEVRAAWLRFPSFRFELLDQSYRRLSAGRYRYRSAGGRFETELDVDENGFVIRYPQFWDREP